MASVLPPMAEPVPGANRPSDCWTASTILYLALPNFIFLFGWFKLLFALPLALLVSIAIWQSLPRHNAQPMLLSQPSTASTLCLLLLAAAWTAFGGAGHFGYANSDWAIRDAVYADLFFGQWPIAYSIQNGIPIILRSAIGYFLPAALVTHWTGPQFADLLLYAWTVIGVFLFLRLLPLPLRSGGRLLACVLIVIMFSGMDYLGSYAATGLPPIFPLRLEWWVPFSYTSLGGQLFWAPNHSLALWLGTALYIRHASSPEFGRLACVYVPLTLIWTPFAPLALLPFLCLSAWYWWSVRGPWPSKMQIAHALILGTLITAFLTLHITKIEATTGLTHTQGGDTFWRTYPLFVASEFLILALLIWNYNRLVSTSFKLALLILLGLPFVFFGPSNDLLLRCSVPALLILLAWTLNVFNGHIAAKQTRRPWAIMLVLLVGAITPLHEMVRAIQWKSHPANYGLNLIEASEQNPQYHYLAKLDSPWLLFMLKPAQSVKTRRDAR